MYRIAERERLFRWGDPVFSFSRTALGVCFVLDNEHRVYGLGERMGRLDKKGRLYRMWNSDEPFHTENKDPLYQSIPLALLFRPEISTGIFLDRPCRSWFDPGYTNPGLFRIWATGDLLDLYILPGPTLKQVVRQFISLTGSPQMPPL